MKKTLLLACLVVSSISLFAQCVIEPFSLQKKIAISDLVVEGTVVSSHSFWDGDHMNIYTSNTIMVHKLFAGKMSGYKVELVTEGGIVGMTMHRSDPSLQVKVGELGVFMLRKCTIELPGHIKDNEYPDYQPSASVQSFIRYELEENAAYGYFKTYLGIESLLFPKIKSFTGKGFESISEGGFKGMIIKSLSAPIIDSFSRDTITAGTGSKLTIYGSNFSFARGSNGRVMFTDPNYGDGRFYDELLDPNYVSWSNSKIEVIVPSRSGTGKVKVVNASSESGISTGTVAILYAHQNIKYGNNSVGIDTAYHQIDLINANGSGGYSWQFNSTFSGNFNAVNAFLRSMETWRCNTLINWAVGDDTSLDQTADDDVNIVRWTTFSDSRLGVCWSRFNGCFSSGPVVHWNSDEQDIEFDKDRNWYYGDNTPMTSQYDFQSVASHELGHGHQMGHVINSDKMMHYSLTIGQRNADLHDDDVSCGIYIRDKSKVKNPCGPNPVIPINVNDCNITRPKASAKANRTTICPGDSIVFMDLSEGVIKTYSWVFGSGASPAGANKKGPHMVEYSESGNFIVSLIVTNDFGSDTFDLEITVDPAMPDIPGIFQFDTIVCPGNAIYIISNVARASDYKWTLPKGGGTLVSADNDTSVTVNWTGKGFFDIEVTASNSCGTSDPRSEDIEVLLTSIADFSFTNNGRTLTFTNESAGAEEYIWRFGDGDTSIDIDPVHEFDQAGTFDVTLDATNICSNSSKTESVKVNWGTGIYDQVGSLIEIYPNPANNEITCSFNNTSGQYESIELLDMSGRVLVVQEILERSEVKLDVTNVSGGVYLIQLSGKSGKSGSYRMIIHND